MKDEPNGFILHPSSFILRVLAVPLLGVYING